MNAIFAGAIKNIFHDAEIEFVLLSHRSLFGYTHVVLAVPPPINLPIVLYRLLAILGGYAHKTQDAFQSPLPPAMRSMIIRLSPSPHALPPYDRYTRRRLASRAPESKSSFSSAAVTDQRHVAPPLEREGSMRRLRDFDRSDESSSRPIPVGLYVERFRAAEAQKRAGSISSLVSTMIEHQNAMRAGLEKQLGAALTALGAQQKQIDAQQRQMEVLLAAAGGLKA